MDVVCKGLGYSYRVAEKEPGMRASLASLFKRTYKTRVALHDINLEIRSGQLVGVLGANGAGKSTLLKLIAGVLAPTRGEVIAGEARPHDRHYPFLRQISMVHGRKSQLDWELPPLDTYRLHREMYGLSEQQYQSRLASLTDALDVEGILRTPVRQLSLGQRMRCEIVAALLHEPRLLLLDEPTIGLDLPTQRSLRGFLLEYSNQNCCTILVSSHHLRDITETCGNVIVLRGGRLVHYGPLDDLVDVGSVRHVVVEYKEPLTPEQTALLAKQLEALGVKQLAVSSTRVVFEASPESARATGDVLFRSGFLLDLRVEAPDIDSVIVRLLKHRDGEGDA